MNRKAVKLVMALVIALSFCAVSQAQQAEATPKPEAVPKQEVSPEKRALIKQILDLTNSRLTSESMFSAQFDEMEKELPGIQWQAISSMDEFKRLTPAQQEEVKQKINESSTRTSKRLKELFLQRIDMKQLVEDISYSVYDKHFTEAELTDLLAFYKSATGKKVVAETPALFAESIAKAAEIISPKVRGIVEEVQKEQTEELTKEVDALVKSAPKTQPKKTTRARRRH